MLGSSAEALRPSSLSVSLPVVVGEIVGWQQQQQQESSALCLASGLRCSDYELLISI